MKLGRASFMIMGLGVFALSFGSIGNVHSQQLTQKESLDKELAASELRLSKVQTDDLILKKTNLEKAITEARQDIQTLKKSLTNTTDSINFSDVILNVAEDSHITIQEIRSSGATNSTLEGLPCSTISVSINADGTVSDIINFVHSFRNALPNILVKSVNITYATENETAEENPEGAIEELPSASIQVMVYSYSGN